jgi:hypothetical protein
MQHSRRVIHPVFNRGDVDGTIQRIKSEIRWLQDVQAAVFNDAIFVGMEPETATECDDRRTRICALMDELIEIYERRMKPSLYGLHGDGFRFSRG